jgi:hypothetical protein
MSTPLDTLVIAARAIIERDYPSDVFDGSTAILVRLRTGVFAGADGDGGNRTHVRGRVKGGFYERSRRSDLVSRLPRRRGSGRPAS